MDAEMEKLLPKKKRDPELMVALSAIIDPELFVPITEMGLIYGAEMKGSTAKILMTLTTIGCPLFDVIQADIEKELKKIDTVENIDIELTFDPPWHAGMLSEAAQIELGLV